MITGPCGRRSNRTADEAQALLAAERGHRTAVGELLQVELDAVRADEDA